MIVPHGYLSSDEEQHDENGNAEIVQSRTCSILHDSDAELFQSSVADRQKAKQAAYQKMRKKKLRKLEIKVRLNNGRDPILILAQQVRCLLIDQKVLICRKAFSGQPTSRLYHGAQAEKGEGESDKRESG